MTLHAQSTIAVSYLYVIHYIYIYTIRVRVYCKNIYIKDACALNWKRRRRRRRCTRTVLRVCRFRRISFINDADARIDGKFIYSLPPHHGVEKIIIIYEDCTRTRTCVIFYTALCRGRKNCRSVRRTMRFTKYSERVRDRQRSRNDNDDPLLVRRSADDPIQLLPSSALYRT